MVNSLNNMSFFFIFSIVLLCTACVPSKQARVAAVAHTFEDVACAAAKQSESSIVRAGTPAYLMLIDGLIEASPENDSLLLAGCRAYTSFAGSLPEDGDRHATAALYARAKNYGFRALSGQRDFREAVSASLEEFTSFLQHYEKKDVPALYWTARSWAGWINLNQDNLEALAEVPMLEATMRRVLELDETFHYDSPHLFMATYLAATPAILGGNLNKAGENFHRALALGEGKFLMAKVLFAEYYAARVGDRTLFEKTLHEVLEAPVDQVPELTLSNALAKDKARKLLDDVDEYFLD
ncbi:MAG: TRAP transporter TatT component family protein [Syntrophobacteria bacterium]